MKTGNIFVVTAPSGAGKTTLVLALLALDSQVRLSVSYTTRAPRPGEVEGKDYHFVSHELFERMLEQGEFLESAEVYGNYYGTSQKWINQEVQSGKDILLEIDWQGAQQVREIFPQAMGIFIVPPSVETLEQRLRRRAQDSEEAIQQRIKAAKEELSHVSEFDYVIVNEHIDEAVRDITSIVRAERLKLAYQISRYTNLLGQ